MKSPQAIAAIGTPGVIAQGRIILCVLSLVIYAALAVLNNQIRNDTTPPWLSYDIERIAMASGISHLVYGAPLGAVYTGIDQAFMRPTMPLNTLFDTAKLKKTELGNLSLYTPGGLGAGASIFTTEAMRIFGLHELSIFWAFFSLLVCATITFLLRFNDRRAAAVFAGLSAFIFMFATPLATTIVGQSQFTVAGYRYFSLLAAVPGLHVFFELTDDEIQLAAGTLPRRLVLLLIQLAIFGITLYVSTAAIYVYGLIALGTVYALLAARRDRSAAGSQLLKVTLVLCVGVLILFAPRDLAPAGYKDAGRTGDMVWHRIFISLGANPRWPFGTLAAEYAGCYPAEPQRTLQPGISDFNGFCVWHRYAEQRHMSEHQIEEDFLGRSYNSVVRETFWKVAKGYPFETLWTFIYFKPLMVKNTLVSLLKFDGTLRWWLFPLIGIQFLLLLVFAGVDATEQRAMRIVPVFTALGLAALCTCGLYIAAWSAQWTTGDLFFYVLSLLSAGLMACTGALIPVFRKRVIAQPTSQ